MAKAFSWSYSKLKNFETCQLKHQQVDLLKAFPDTSEQLDWGNDVHKKLADACSGKAPLPITMKEYQHWVDEVRGGQGEILVEQKYALNRQLEPVEFFSPNAWFRCIGDLVKVVPPVALAWDWKTGKPIMDSVQLILGAACIFAHHPDVKRIKTEFIWLKEDTRSGDVYTPRDVARMWEAVLPRVERMQHAYTTSIYTTTPSGLCRGYCPVTTCQHWKPKK